MKKTMLLLLLIPSTFLAMDDAAANLRKINSSTHHYCWIGSNQEPVGEEAFIQGFTVADIKAAIAKNHPGTSFELYGEVTSDLDREKETQKIRWDLIADKWGCPIDVRKDHQKGERTIRAHLVNNKLTIADIVEPMYYVELKAVEN